MLHPARRNRFLFAQEGAREPSRTKRSMFALATVVAVFTLAGAETSTALAQPLSVHKTPLQDQPFPDPPLHTTMVRTIIDPHGEVAPHTHPGLELAYVVSGDGMVTIDGQAPRSLVAGDSFAAPADTVHSVKNTASRPLILVSTYVVDMTKPIATPAHTP